MTIPTITLDNISTNFSKRSQREDGSQYLAWLSPEHSLYHSASGWHQPFLVRIAPHEIAGAYRVGTNIDTIRITSTFINGQLFKITSGELGEFNFFDWHLPQIDLETPPQTITLDESNVKDHRSVIRGHSIDQRDLDHEHAHMLDSHTELLSNIVGLAKQNHPEQARTYDALDGDIDKLKDKTSYFEFRVRLVDALNHHLGKGDIDNHSEVAKANFQLAKKVLMRFYHEARHYNKHSLTLLDGVRRDDVDRFITKIERRPLVHKDVINENWIDQETPDE